ncbi:MAG: phosphoadenosine phosphosulfate reductase family protein [bacterium]
MANKKVRHVLGLSGGKDSTALAVYLHKKIPDLEYFFCDTHKELPETYEYLDRIKARLGIKITYLSAARGFDHWLEIHCGYLPSPQARWCTKQLKLLPFEQYVGNDEVYSYIAIRADEDREGYISHKPNIKPVFPFKEAGIRLNDVYQILEESGIGMPKYYSWRSRSGCFFCFFQRKYEWVKLAEEHPDLFAQAVKYEQEHSDGRKFTWVQDESLTELIMRKEQVLADHQKAMARKRTETPNRPLVDVLSSVLDAEDDQEPCLVCHL